MKLRPLCPLARRSAVDAYVISSSVVVEVRLGIRFASGVPERIRERAGRCGLLAEGVKRVGLGEYSGGIGKRSDCAEAVSVIVFIVAGCGAAKHGQRFIDVQAL